MPTTVNGYELNNINEPEPWASRENALLTQIANLQPSLANVLAGNPATDNHWHNYSYFAGSTTRAINCAATTNIGLGGNFTPAAKVHVRDVSTAQTPVGAPNFLVEDTTAIVELLSAPASNESNIYFSNGTLNQSCRIRTVNNAGLLSELHFYTNDLWAAKFMGNAATSGHMLLGEPAMIAEVPYTKIHIKYSDTGLAPFGAGTAAIMNSSIILESNAGGGLGPTVQFLMNNLDTGGIHWRNVAAQNMSIQCAPGLYLLLGGMSTNMYISGATGTGVGIGGTGAFSATVTSADNLDLWGKAIRIRTAQTIAASATAGSVGEICWDASYIYVCTALNTWKRAAIAAW